MAQNYSDPSRATDPYSLPDIETFHMSADQIGAAEKGTWMHDAIRDRAADGPELEEYEAAQSRAACSLEGWYWWSCFPGCIPDSDPSGPFKTEETALEDAQNF